MRHILAGDLYTYDSRRSCIVNRRDFGARYFRGERFDLAVDSCKNTTAIELHEFDNVLLSGGSMRKAIRSLGKQHIAYFVRLWKVKFDALTDLKLLAHLHALMAI